VSHGVTIRMLLAHWGAWPERRIESTPSIPTGTGVLVTWSPGAAEESACPRNVLGALRPLPEH
jgi:broad specificity phosphatase PhoE